VKKIAVEVLYRPGADRATVILPEGLSQFEGQAIVENVMLQLEVSDLTQEPPREPEEMN
jgi:hypothetical protein